MEVPDPMGGIVQSVTPSMPGKLNSTCVLVLLFIFKLHFLNTCFSHVQCGVHTNKNTHYLVCEYVSVHAFNF